MNLTNYRYRFVIKPESDRRHMIVLADLDRTLVEIAWGLTLKQAKESIPMLKAAFYAGTKAAKTEMLDLEICVGYAEKK